MLNTLDFEELLLFRGHPELVQELDRVRQQKEYLSPKTELADRIKKKMEVQAEQTTDSFENKT